MITYQKTCLPLQALWLVSLCLGVLPAGNAIPKKNVSSQFPKRPQKRFIFVLDFTGLAGLELQPDGTLRLLDFRADFPYLPRFPAYLVGAPSQPFLYGDGNEASWGSPDGKAHGNIYAFQIDPNGQPRPIGGEFRNSTPAGELPGQMQISGDGHFLYCASHQNSTQTNRIYQYRIRSNGSLLPLNPASIAVEPGDPVSLIINPSYPLLHTAGEKLFTSYTITRRGALHLSRRNRMPLPGTDLIAFSHEGHYLSISPSHSKRIMEYSVDPRGRVVPLAFKAAILPEEPVQMIGSPTQAMLYVRFFHDRIPQTVRYSIQGNGLLTRSSRVAVGPQDNISFDPSGRFAYTKNTGGGDLQGGSIEQFRVTADGKFVHQTTLPLDGNPINTSPLIFKAIKAP